MRAKSSVETGSSTNVFPIVDPKLPLSKSETNLTDSDSFVLISEAEVTEVRNQDPNTSQLGSGSPTQKEKSHRNSLLPGKFSLERF